MLLCLPLFLGFAAEAQAQTECVSEDLLDHVEAKIEIEPTDRWVRIKNALTEQSNAMPLSEAKSILANRKANGWNLNRFDDVVAAMECLAKPKPGGLEADDAPQACVSPTLAADVKGYSEETWHGSAHVERWLRVLQTFSGTANDSTVMTPAEAQEMADRWSNGRWDPVVDALQCLEVEALNEQVEVEDETEPAPLIIEDTVEPEDTPQPLNAEETPMPAQSDPIDTTSMRVYFHGGTRPPGSEYRINEDDHWESELIIHYVSNQAIPYSNDNLCVNTDIWGGPDYWHNGPITLPGFNDPADITDPVFSAHPLYPGIWRCTGPADDSPYVTVIQDDANGIEFVYRATVRTRDNNVVEDDFDIANDLEFKFTTSATAPTKSVSSGTTKWGPETLTEPDRAAYLLKRDVVAWPDGPASISLGDGNQWVDYSREAATCGIVSQSRWIDRADRTSGSHVQDLVRADVAADVWLPDHCYPTKEVPKIPPTPYNTQPGVTFNNEEIPIIEEDDVSWIDLHKVNGKWTVSLSKPVMVTDGVNWNESSEGLSLNLAHWSVQRSTQSVTYLMIPAVNGIVADKDYTLNDLQEIQVSSGSFSFVGRTWGTGTCARTYQSGPFAGQLLGARLAAGGTGQTFVSTKNLNSYNNAGDGLRMDLPPTNSDLCN